MSKAQVIHRLGPPEVMQWQDWPVPDPGPGEVRLRHTAIGVNFADTYHRGGISHPWKVDAPPVVIGFEGVGIVEGVGDGVTAFKTGDRVAYGIPPLGSYSEIRNYPADKLLHLPERLDDKEVAALLMKGMTAHYLLHRTYAVQPGDTILVHAAAGGMGLILCQWAKALGATTVGTVSTEEKAEVARAAGCDHPVVRSRQSFVDVVREVTDGEGCAVVYEAIGKDTLQDSLDCLRLMGVCAAYGHVSGPPGPVDIIQDLGRRGSLFITRPAIMHYVARRSDLEWTARDLFKAIGDGILDANINYEYPLKDAVKAHEAIESGKTLGATVMIP
ncbi:quinone oxidoreductase family protein [Pseudoponticoccus marisrubri]|uniref:Quinone oxidoreductase n=1 Tax=Pseudoponticoccus marisrubri TaxID=1685382 RepID=A0A0W7WE30_9RHOB|nr:quinone oxidoreductase [Pseudoponticoccus marisrubri]KUF08899.1 quinone oxidoreductase [Pseudoponticoccus marisrubri]